MSAGRQFSKKYSSQKIPESVVAWVATWIGRFTLHNRSDQKELEEGHPFSLTLTFSNGGYKTFDLTSLTEVELDKLIEFFVLVVDEIRPVIRHRDEVARRAQAGGDGTFARNYRAVPQLVVLERPSRDNTKGIHQRPEDAGSGSEDTSGGGSGRNGDAVAEPASEPSGSEDNSA